MFYYRLTKKIVLLAFKIVSCFINKQRLNSIKKRVILKIDIFNKESVNFKRDYKKLLIVVILTTIQIFFYYLVVYFVLLSRNVEKISLLKVLSMQSMIILITSIFPIPGGAVGAEYSFSKLFSSYLGNSNKLILGMFLWRAITYYLGIILGIIAMIFPPKKMTKNNSR